MGRCQSCRASGKVTRFLSSATGTIAGFLAATTLTCFGSSFFREVEELVEGAAAPLVAAGVASRLGVEFCD